MKTQDIKTLAHVYALVADMNAVMVESNGIMAENAYRESTGHTIAYGEENFEDLRARLAAIADELTRISDGEIE